MTALHEVGDQLFAYVQRDGGWGWSNAGLVMGDGSSLLVDTLFDLKTTQAMLDTMAPLISIAGIEAIVNTHANGDHCYGNELVPGVDIIASEASADEMDELPPQALAALVDLDVDPLTRAYLQSAFGPFEFRNITMTPPTTTFSGRHEVDVAGRKVELIEVGPAHTRGDTLAYVPDADAIFTGDILFIHGTPIIWDGPVQNWVDACDLITGLGVTTVVPGHGPVCGLDGVEMVRGYLVWLYAEAKQRFEVGMSAQDAARDIELGSYADWGESERIAINVDSIYRELDPSHESAGVLANFTLMAELANR